MGRHKRGYLRPRQRRPQQFCIRHRPLPRRKKIPTPARLHQNKSKLLKHNPTSAITAAGTTLCARPANPLSFSPIMVRPEKFHPPVGTCLRHVMATNHYVTTNYGRLVGAQYVAPAPQIPSQELHTFRIFRLFQTPSAVGDGLLWFLHASEGAAGAQLGA